MAADMGCQHRHCRFAANDKRLRPSGYTHAAKAKRLKTNGYRHPPIG